MRKLDWCRAFTAVLALVFFVLLVLPVDLLGQDASTTPSPSPTISPSEARLNAIIVELERQKRIAEIERDIAKANKESLDATPAPKVSPKTGGLTISPEDIGYDIIVYRELEKATSRVAESVRRTVPNKSTIAIFDNSAFADWRFYRSSLPLFKIVIEDLTSDYCLVANSKVVNPNKSGPFAASLANTLAGSGNIVGQFADLLSYLKTDTTMTGKAVSVSEEAVVAALFSDLRRDQGMTLLYPKTFAIDSPVLCGQTTGARACCLPGVADCTETRPVYCSEVANSLDALYRARRAAFASKDESPELKKLEKYFEDFIRLFADASPTTAETALKRYVNAEQFAELQKRDDLYYLEIKSLRAVGTQRIRKNLFFLSDKLDYSGGVVLQWTLFDKLGNVRNSGIETSFDGFVPPQQLRREPVP